MFTRRNAAMHPEISNLLLGQISLEYSRHALDRAYDKGVTVEGSMFVPKGAVVEIEMISSKITKAVVRMPQSVEVDRVFVLVPLSRSHWKVVTVWLNAVSDTHQTLNKERLSA